MTKKIFTLLALALFASGATLTSASSYNDAIKIAKAQNKKVLAFFHTEYCPWCNKMKKTTLKDQEVVAFINKDFIFVSIDKDKDTYPAKFRPRFVPTTYTIDPKTGEEIQSAIGFQTPEGLIDALKEE